MRKLSVWAWIGLTLVYLVLLQGIGLLLTSGIGAKYAAPTTVNETWRQITLPVGVSLVLVLGIVAALRWWRPVFVDDRPVRQWLWAIPAIQLVCVLGATDYIGLTQKTVGFVVLLLVSTLMVGFAEEAMFRGIGLTSLRNGHSEGKAALWSTVVFGLAHGSNLIVEGPKAFGQMFLAAVSGYFLYIGRRVSGNLFLPALVHGLWDFSLISGSVVSGKQYYGGFLSVLGVLVMAIVLLVGRRHIEPGAVGTSGYRSA